MKVEIRHLQLVDAITAAGSVTAAAERLHVTQSALSHQLREIEDRLGTPLFLRVNRRLSLAPAGQRLLDSARRVLTELRSAEEDIERLANHQDGLLRVSTECYTSYHWLPSLLKSFRRRFPGVELEIVPEVRRNVTAALLDRQIDLALVFNARRDARLKLHPLFEDEIVVIVANDHPLAGRPFVCASDLADQHLITHSPADESFFMNRLTTAGVRPRKHSQVILTEAIVELVKAGLGISALARWTIARELRSGGIVALPFTRKPLMRRWSAATLRTSTPSAPMTELIQLMKSTAL
ncbi:MAG TPA: LysR family transcriptional regulator [Thermoanaerobaculia bacterium]|jgi:LysR family transcriptional regulator for metE and metH